MLRDAELNSLVRGDFSLDSLRITLTRNGTGIVDYAGPGDIRQGPGGGLELRLYDAEAPLKKPQPWIAGEVIPDGEYCTMEARAVDGTEWHSTFVLPDPSWDISGVGCVVTASLSEITSEEEAMSVTSPRLELLFHRPLRLPTNAYSKTKTESGAKTSQELVLDTAEFEAATMSFHCRVYSDRTAVNIRADSLPMGVDVHVIGALQFLLGQEVRFVHSRQIVEGMELTTVRSTNLTSEPRLQNEVQPPLVLDLPHSVDAWKLFDCYLSTAIASNSTEFHPLAVEWEPVIRGRSAGLEGQALLWAVAVEAILKLVDPEGASLAPTHSEEDKMVVEWTEKAKAAIAEMGCSATVIARLDGLFRPLMALSSGARLKRLAEIGAIDGATVKSWVLVRNTRAHGSQGKLKSPSQILAARDAVLALLYQLVFHGIGYDGAAIAYNRRNWPEYVYPKFLDPETV